MMDTREKVAGWRKRWALWNGWGPLESDGLMRVERIGPGSGGGLSSVSGTVLHDISGTREDLELVVNAVNALLGNGEVVAKLEVLEGEVMFRPVDHTTGGKLLIPDGSYDIYPEHAAPVEQGEPVAEIFEFRCNYPQIRYLRPDDLKVGDKLYLHAALHREPEGD